MPVVPASQAASADANLAMQVSLNADMARALWPAALAALSLPVTCVDCGAEHHLESTRGAHTVDCKYCGSGPKQRDLNC